MRTIGFTVSVIIAVVLLAALYSGPAAGQAKLDGKAIFLAQKCNTCHSVSTEGIAATTKSEKMKGPDLINLKHDAKLLATIPGVGDLTAAFLLGCAGDLRRFSNPRKLDAYAGMNPAIRQSGRWVGHSRLSKLGPALLRAKLYMPALTATRYNTAVHALYERLIARGKPRMVALAAAMRKLLHIAWGVIHSGKAFDSKIALA